ncbi:MAG: hypothetical protein F4X60_00240 [Gemmatimonadetes bacterium]|nr:hypothetical protein [Gemmatimonadota bacterium]MYB96973.1 hypothetical protein [Gemmatimonadota bacterium]
MKPPSRRRQFGRRTLPTLLVLACTLPGCLTAQPPNPVAATPTQDAYLDETARRLVLGARHARDTARLAMDSYTALVRERVGFVFPTFQRDRPWVSGERAARVRWSRDAPAEVRVLDARFRRHGPAPGGLARAFPELHAEQLAADPYGNPFVYGFGPTVGAAMGTAAIAVRDPLGADAERYYQFRSGDTTRLQLEGGHSVDAVAVTVIPRYRSIRLVAAILWIDPGSHALVRVAYRPAKRVDREMRGRFLHGGGWDPRVWIDGGQGGGPPGDDPATPPPGLIARLINIAAYRMAAKLEIDLAAVVVDFAPWEGRHWLPRRVRWDGHLAWEIVSATAFVPPGVPFSADWALEIEEVRAPGDPAPPIATSAGTADTSDLLPPSIWRDDPSAGRDRPGVAGALAAIGVGQGGDRSEAANPWFFFPPGMALGLMRYTPVEGYSAGGLVRRDFGWWRSQLTVRIPTSGWAVPDMDFTLQHDHPQRKTQFSVYRQLRGGALGIGGLEGWTGYFVRAADSVNFHWTHGASLRFTPGNGLRNRLSFSVFAEQDAEIDTDAERTRVGGALEWKPWWGAFGDRAVGVGGNVIVRGSAGDNPHVKALVEGAVVVPVVAGLSFGLQGGAAGVWGDPAPQDLWEVGAAGYWFRGHSGAVATSRTWMGRVDLQRSVRFLHVSVYGDRASAEGADYCAVGAGLVFMDGLLRLDVAKGLVCGRQGSSRGGWRFHPRGFTFF